MELFGNTVTCSHFCWRWRIHIHTPLPMEEMLIAHQMPPIPRPKSEVMPQANGIRRTFIHTLPIITGSVMPAPIMACSHATCTAWKGWATAM